VARWLLIVTIVSGLLSGQSFCCCAVRSISTPGHENYPAGSELPIGCCCCDGASECPGQEHGHDCPCKRHRQFVDSSAAVEALLVSQFQLGTWWLQSLACDLVTEMEPPQLSAWWDVDWGRRLPLRLDLLSLGQLLRC
jgi:hypothetical protein